MPHPRNIGISRSHDTFIFLKACKQFPKAASLFFIPISAWKSSNSSILLPALVTLCLFNQSHPNNYDVAFHFDFDAWDMECLFWFLLAICMFSLEGAFDVWIGMSSYHWLLHILYCDAKSLPNIWCANVFFSCELSSDFTNIIWSSP